MLLKTGLIDVPMYEQLLNADLVIADLSTSNRNAFYELGIRHALRPYTTIIIAENGIKTFPFDVNRVVIRQYNHLGEDIGYGEVMRFTKLLTQSIIDIMNKEPRDKDSPVYSFLHGLKEPEFADAIQVAGETFAETSSEKKDDKIDLLTFSILMNKADEAQKKNDWVTAKAFLYTILDTFKQQPSKNKDYDYILQKLAYVTYKSKHPSEADALNEAHDLLKLLDSNTSNDTETLGLWGKIHEKLWELTKDVKILDEAVRAYERGLHLRKDFSNGINYAFLLNVRAKQTSDLAEAIADFVQAGRVRKEVISICEKWLSDNPIPQNDDQNSKITEEYWNSWYLVMVTLADAYIGLNNDVKANEILDQAYKKAPERSMKECTEKQIEQLKQLLIDSPLDVIKR